MSTQPFNCRICNSKKATDWTFREMMFGLKHQFKYKECNNCGCIQIEAYPKNIADYYPDNYYSFNSHISSKYKFIGKVERIKTRVLLYNHLVFKDVIGAIGKRTFPPFRYNLQFLQSIDLKPSGKILDIGCGNGEFLLQLYKSGFTNLTGIDKFIKEDLFLFNKIHIWKKEIIDLKTKYDLITMHHVFEHMHNQEAVLKSIQTILKSNGNLIIRIPIVNEPWKIYRENWVQLDAPRHYYLHSMDSFKLLAKNAGFIVTDIVFDSYALQFWGSEQYKMDIPLRNDKRSYAENQEPSIFSSLQISEWENKSIELNNNSKGDQAIFYLRKNG